jgi:hypothetical protein
MKRCDAVDSHRQMKRCDVMVGSSSPVSLYKASRVCMYRQWQKKLEHRLSSSTVAACALVVSLTAAQGAVVVQALASNEAQRTEIPIVIGWSCCMLPGWQCWRCCRLQRVGCISAGSAATQEQGLHGWSRSLSAQGPVLGQLRLVWGCTCSRQHAPVLGPAQAGGTALRSCGHGGRWAMTLGGPGSKWRCRRHSAGR